MKKLIKYDLKNYCVVGAICILVLILNLWLNYATENGGANLTIMGFIIILFYSVSKISKEAINTCGYTINYLLPYSKNEILLSKIISFIIISSLYTLIAIILFWGSEKNIKCLMGFLHNEFDAPMISLNISLIWSLFCTNISNIALLIIVVYTDIKFKLRVKNSVFNNITKVIVICALLFIILAGTLNLGDSFNLGINIADINRSTISKLQGPFVTVTNKFIQINFTSLLIYIGLGLYCFKGILKSYRFIDVR
ncbi:hypothetical protein SAMN02745163_00584 [Clostridium cavendishii DSM 21758]|uniref:ABC-2 family transporter protein n=1 Tax=Clostridium cavendishii DSM 21758 TaxID=1121302 RepID=A0A1M6CXS8_9CLOT|nr:hypothetical protein [Clostridium cavendishii]SHI65797.1 hypothetical protein SAMN02745163_00584 [Clostridium cavendishii DSM 21758]